MEDRASRRPYAPVLLHLNLIALPLVIVIVVAASVDILLLRHDDRIIWIQVDELGNRYMKLSMKGLELQETSCHSLEATRIDDIFDSAFQNKSWRNKFYLHTLQPWTQIQIKMYSDTQNQLNTLLNYSETLDNIAETFIEALIWFLVDYIDEKPAFTTTPSKNKVADNNDAEDKTAVIPIQIQVQANNDNSQDVSIENTPVTNLKPLSPVSPDTWAHSKGERPRLPSIKNPRYLQRRDSLHTLESNSDVFDHLEDDIETRTMFLNESKGSIMLPEVEARRLSAVYSQALPGILNESDNKKLTAKSYVENTFLTPIKKCEHLEAEVKRFVLPESWLEILNIGSHVAAMDEFPERFFQYCLEKREDKLKNKSNIFVGQYKVLVNHLFQQVYGKGGRHAMLSQMMGPSFVYKTFHDVGLDNIPDELQSLAQKAYRAAFKVALDKTVIDRLDNSELHEEFLDLKWNWYLGSQNDQRWKESVLNKVPKIFSLQKSESIDSNQQFYKAHILKLQDCQTSVGKLNSSVVRGLWASLSFELLYLTNDDDERYSIQAEEHVLRNLTVQAANYPLGYAAYSSESKTFYY